MSDPTPTDPWGNPLPEQDAPTSPGSPQPDASSSPPERPDAWWPGSGDPQPTPPQGWSQPGGAAPPPGHEGPGQAGLGQAGPGQAGWGQAGPDQAGWGQPGYGQQPIWGPQGQWIQPPQKTERTAVASLVCAIVGLLLCGIILEPVAIALGFQARKKIRNSNGFLKGEGIAIAGIVIGIIGLLLAIAGMIILLSDPDLLNTSNS